MMGFVIDSVNVGGMRQSREKLICHGGIHENGSIQRYNLCDHCKVD
jgi:hypothetical protein